MKDGKWLRAKFIACGDDYRPVSWPPPGPYWCTGYNFDFTQAIVVAYVREYSQIIEFWPEATEIKFSDREEISFTDRFRQPKWWKEIKVND